MVKPYITDEQWISAGVLDCPARVVAERLGCSVAHCYNARRSINAKRSREAWEERLVAPPPPPEPPPRPCSLPAVIPDAVVVELAQISSPDVLDVLAPLPDAEPDDFDPYYLGSTYYHRNRDRGWYAAHGLYLRALELQG